MNPGVPRQANIEDVLELSPYQRQMLQYRQQNPDSTAWRTQSWVKIDGPLDVERLRHAFEQIISTHGILRTSFHWKNLSKPVQVVHRHAPVRFITTEVSGDSSAALEAQLQRIVVG